VSRRKRGAAGWCEANGIEAGDRIELLLVGEWVPVTVTALGQTAILTRRKGAAEFAHQKPTKLRLPQSEVAEIPVPEVPPVLVFEGLVEGEP